MTKMTSVVLTLALIAGLTLINRVWALAHYYKSPQRMKYKPTLDTWRFYVSIHRAPMVRAIYMATLVVVGLALIFSRLDIAISAGLITIALTLSQMIIPTFWISPRSVGVLSWVLPGFPGNSQTINWRDVIYLKMHDNRCMLITPQGAFDVVFDETSQKEAVWGEMQAIMNNSGAFKVVSKKGGN